MNPRPHYLRTYRTDTHRVQLMETEAACDIAPDPTRTFRPASSSRPIGVFIAIAVIALLCTIGYVHFVARVTS